jgi:hypothetical protein
MIRNIKLRICCIAFVSALAAVPALNAQQTKATPSAPVPGGITTGRKVFISNAGVDGTSLVAFKKAGGANQPYNEFYAAMKNWGRYELVGAPADAELVFEIRFAAPLVAVGNVNTYGPELELAILDSKTHFRLWTLTEPVEGAFRKATWDRNFSQGMASLMADIEKLVAEPSAGGNPSTH